MNHYLYAIKIIILFFVGHILGCKSLKQKYGFKLFHWVMPYCENEGYSVTLKHKDETIHKIRKMNK